MPKHILVAHDLSPEADLALQRGVQLALQSGARLTLLHVPTAAIADDTPIRARLEARLQGLGLPQGKVLLRRGRPVVEILLQARGLAIDLLVLGAHHRQSPEGFAGTTLERILQSSPAPVLLAVNAEPTPWTRALVALDYSPCASRALQQAWALLGDGATLHALHIHEVEEVHASEDPAAVAFERELFDRLVSDEGSALPARPAQLSHELRHGERQSCLQAVLAERQPQLLALGAHSRGMLADVLLGSLALELLRQPPCDVLVVR
ncbi:universal stress protein [Geopseudomonas aromaticivorans]